MRLQLSDQELMEIRISVHDKNATDRFCIEDLGDPCPQNLPGEAVLGRHCQEISEQVVKIGCLEIQLPPANLTGHSYTASLPDIQQSDLGQVAVCGADRVVVNSEAL